MIQRYAHLFAVAILASGAFASDDAWLDADWWIGVIGTGDRACAGALVEHLASWTAGRWRWHGIAIAFSLGHAHIGAAAILALRAFASGDAFLGAGLRFIVEIGTGDWAFGAAFVEYFACGALDWRRGKAVACRVREREG